MSSIATNEEEKAPYYGTKNNDLPRKDLFRELRKRWQFKTGRTASALAPRYGPLSDYAMS